ncbi:MAG: DUF3054 domain-containing protein [Corynebacterium sp.]|uniref:DUF3054 domain-containing protein n=1 Tax=Corynebacterium sp. TaxID=1720 RepID=UPI00270BFB0A|nr:DUF3054 domain-containing protein [Corynebacterium sp.]
MSRPSAILADVVAIAVFALLARMAHQSDDMPFTFGGWLSTLWPFLIGVAVAWVVIAAAKWDGAKLHPAGWVAWLIVVVVGLSIWGIRNQAFPHWSFIIVASVMSVILMLGWRAVAKAVTRRRTPVAA